MTDLTLQELRVAKIRCEHKIKLAVTESIKEFVNATGVSVLDFEINTYDFKQFRGPAYPCITSVQLEIEL